MTPPPRLWSLKWPRPPTLEPEVAPPPPNSAPSHKKVGIFMVFKHISC